MPIYYIQYYNRKSRLVQIPEAATGGVLRKKELSKILQNSKETPVSDETPVIFAKFLREHFFTEKLWTTASEMRTLQNQNERNRLSLL